MASPRSLRAATWAALHSVPLTAATWTALRRGEAVTLGVAPEEYVHAVEVAMVTRRSRAPPQHADRVSACRTVEYWRAAANVRALAKPWTSALQGMQFWLAAVICAHPSKGRGTHQPWHTDWTAPMHGGPKGKPKLSVFVYLTDVGSDNGGTEFKRPSGRGSFTVAGPRGTVVAFLSHRVQHRGRLNATRKDRRAAMFTFADPAEPVPYGLATDKPRSEPHAGVKRKREGEVEAAAAPSGRRRRA